MNFLRHALGDDIGYNGKGLELAHMHLDIKKADFDEVAKLLSEALDKEGIQTDVRDEILEILAGTEKLIVKE
jgi:truncated hemoglobin YjbI